MIKQTTRLQRIGQGEHSSDIDWLGLWEPQGAYFNAGVCAKSASMVKAMKSMNAENMKEEVVDDG